MYNTMNTLSSLAGGTLSNREGFGDCQTSKRRKLRDPCRDADEEASFEISDPFADISLYALPDSLVYAPSTGCYPQQTLIACPSASDSSTAVPYTASDQLGLSTPGVDWLHLLGLNSFDAVLPDRASRIIPIALPNPYSDNAHNRISSIETIVTYAPENGEVNGYVKFKMFKPGSIHEPPPTRIPLRFQSAQETHLRRDDEEEQTTATATGRVSLIGGKARVVKIPRNFGLGCNLRPYERKIFRFYIDAFCSGRTILPKSNSWKVDLGPMLPTSEIVRNALLALASTYLLGYTPDENLRILANRYYHLAVVGLTKRLQDAEQWEIGKGDDIVATFSLLNLHDAVTWEYRRGLDEVPRWLEGARTAAKFLDVTDPGYRYYKPGNVQTSSARTGNMVNIARVAIFALPFTPLDVANTSNKKFGWLLHGTSASVHRIHGTAGYSPKLLHIWAQITHLAAKFSTDPDHHVIPSLAEVIFNRLERLSQWSDLSKGHSSTKDLLEACVLDADGLITEPVYLRRGK
ncbi:hypothetical protein EG327_008214 [Venturia inaequalis]|uniref:Uncharacterized protein n=1 Tax=Venturia inaequalis TaxID=5025 RepID=A0A8H3YW51_VENIN|nr:hypothetical protein EG327_008214 [Venturia inaequalis]